ncbi:MAG TPA: ribosomal protein S18-alanine N-acetyltransferase [Terriglobales bacterium]|nr:ribosomal protein S18-alanine N-acetyltransferase [Terriglobales bacterium]
MQTPPDTRNDDSRVIRLATGDDIGRLLVIANEAATSAFWSEEKYQQRMAGDSGVVLVWQESDEIGGFLVARAVAGECEIENLAIASKHRRKGHGRRLVEAAISAANERACKSIWLEVRESNRAARQFYECLGFCEAGRRKRYYRDPEEDALLLKLSLSEAPKREIATG